MRCTVKNCRDEAEIIHKPSGNDFCEKHFRLYCESKEKNRVEVSL